MNQFTKLTLVLTCLGMLLALAACMGPKNATDPVRIVGKTAALIADFTPPSDYAPEYGLHALGYTAVAYNSGDNSHLYLVQSEAEADGAALKKALDEMVPGYRDEEGDLVVVEQRPYTIRNQDVTVTISEGTGWDNEMVRQATAVFRGKEGPALLLLSTPADDWDQAAVDTFLASIH